MVYNGSVILFHFFIRLPVIKNVTLKDTKKVVLITRAIMNLRITLLSCQRWHKISFYDCGTPHISLLPVPLRIYTRP